jgi:hypothetical protein
MIRWQFAEFIMSVFFVCMYYHAAVRTPSFYLSSEYSLHSYDIYVVSIRISSNSLLF